MSDVRERIEGKLAEIEAAAKAVLEGDLSEGRWRWDSHRLKPYRSALVNDRDAVVLPPKDDDVYPSVAVAAHIALNDPAAVLAWVAGIRAVVALHGPRVWAAQQGAAEATFCEICGPGPWPCPTLLAIAGIWDLV